MPTTRQQLLGCLKTNRAQWISGGQISTRLGISRTAIWKQIKALKEQGHQIESAPKKGYRLISAADILDPDEIQALLRTRVMGRPAIHAFAETDSTNLQAKILAAQGARQGTLVVADAQTRGRGRRGRSWFSPPGQSICASIILRPPMAPAQAPRITLMTAVATALTLIETAGLEASIKWPNDILIQGKKIAGILTEISTEMDQIDYVVVGLGINVHSPRNKMPDELKQIATSVNMEKGTRLTRTELLCALLQQFEICYERLITDGFAPIMDQWRRLTDIIGQKVYVDVLNIRHTGVVQAVDDDGVLILEDDHGRTHRIFSADVIRVRKS